MFIKRHSTSPSAIAGILLLSAVVGSWMAVFPRKTVSVMYEFLSSIAVYSAN